MTQLPLFTSDSERQLQAEVAWLRQRLEHAKTIFRQQQAELNAAKYEAADWCGQCLTLRAELEHAGGMASDERRQLQQRIAGQDRIIERQDRRMAERDQTIRLLRAAIDMYRQLAPYPGARSGPPLTRDDLKELLTVAHPDKWSQGQPATKLAHELTVAINRLRQHAEMQP
jgi:hypothetical protein